MIDEQEFKRRADEALALLNRELVGRHLRPELPREQGVVSQRAEEGEVVRDRGEQPGAPREILPLVGEQRVEHRAEGHQFSARAAHERIRRAPRHVRGGVERRAAHSEGGDPRELFSNSIWVGDNYFVVPLDPPGEDRGSVGQDSFLAILSP